MVTAVVELGHRPLYDFACNDTLLRIEETVMYDYINHDLNKSYLTC